MKGAKALSKLEHTAASLAEASSLARNLPGEASQIAKKGSQNPKVAVAAAKGRQVHSDWDYGPGFRKELLCQAENAPMLLIGKRVK